MSLVSTICWGKVELWLCNGTDVAHFAKVTVGSLPPQAQIELAESSPLPPDRGPAGMGLREAGRK